jgi:hypothetical protein
MSASQGVRLGLGIVAAALFFFAAQQMDIHSQSGDSINEAFYQAMGIFSYAMAALSLAVAWPANPAHTLAAGGQTDGVSPTSEQANGGPPPQ